ncbi:hypothetical protein ACFWG5_05915 [Streptomyces hydrogenans]|uniref:hypothetical protein n=1 Tax=Streptomyces hydrogenans TaxID=1873719 RepID=UPI00365D93ED
MAWSEREGALEALEELSERVCELGFVVSEVTPRVIPFLLELAGREGSEIREEILSLLSSIYSAHQWAEAASGASSKYRAQFEEKVHWEVECRGSINAGRSIVQALANDREGPASSAAKNLLDAMNRDDPPGNS